MTARSLLPLGLAFAAFAAAGCRIDDDGRHDDRYDDDRRGRRTAEVSGPQGESMRLVAPADQTFRRGETTSVRVAVRRDGIAGPIDLDFAGLPKGLEIVEKDVRIRAGEESADVTFHAKPDADLVSGHAVKVTAAVPDGKAVSAHFRVSVRAN